MLLCTEKLPVKSNTTATVAAVTLTTLGDATQIGSVLLMLNCPWWQVQLDLQLQLKQCISSYKGSLQYTLTE